MMNSDTRVLDTRRWNCGFMVIVTLALAVFVPSLTFADGIDSRFFRTETGANSNGAWLGVQVETVDRELISRFDLKVSEGVYVRSVVDASPAEDAGALPGDVIIEYNYQNVASAQELVNLVSENRPGDEVILFVDRNGNKKRLVTHLTTRPVEQPSRIRELTPPDADRQGSFRYRVNSVPYIGVSLQSISEQLADYFAVPGRMGALIVRTLVGSPAEEAGLKAGDVVIAADGSEIAITEDLQRVVREHESGDRIELTVIRDRRKTRFTVTVAERESSRREFGNSGVFGFSDPRDDNANLFDLRTRRFDSGFRGRGLEPLQLPDVIYSRTKEKSQRIDNLEKKIKELEKQIETLRENDSDE